MPCRLCHNLHYGSKLSFSSEKENKKRCYVGSENTPYTNLPSLELRHLIPEVLKQVEWPFKCHADVKSDGNRTLLKHNLLKEMLDN